MGERWENCGLWDDGRAAGSILVIDAGNRVKRVIISLPISCVSTLLLNGSCRRTTQPYDRFGFKQTSRWQHNDQSGQVVCGRPFPRSYKESSRFSRKDDPKGAKNGIKKKKNFAIISLWDFCKTLWCPEQDLNLHSFRNTHLKRARLPIPPPGRPCQPLTIETQSVCNFVPRTRLELAPPYGDYPLKVACLPIPPPGQRLSFFFSKADAKVLTFFDMTKKNSLFLKNITQYIVYQ